MADIAAHAHTPQLIALDPPPAVPFPEWMDHARVAAALRESNLTKLFGR